jgi:predicted amidohydrolase
LTPPPSALRLGVAQPPARSQGPEEVKVGDAVATIAEAGAAGVELLLFPESYPGPIRAGSESDATAAIVGAAKSAGCAVCWGRVERGDDGLYRTLAYLHGADGSELLRYERSHPATGDVHPVLSGVPMAPGPRLGVADVGPIRVGVAVCSELWIPEVSRALALAGAEVILAPAGGGFHRVASNWQLIARARAVENQLHVALTQALFGDEEGSALIAGPERVLASTGDPVLLVADCDLERARWLRSHDDSMREPKGFDALPGLVRARRPELYGVLAQRREGLYDYEGAARPAPSDE